MHSFNTYSISRLDTAGLPVFTISCNLTLTGNSECVCKQKGEKSHRSMCSITCNKNKNFFLQN